MCVVVGGDWGMLSRRAGHLFQKLQHSLNDLRLSLHLQSRSSRRPCRVATEEMLLWRRDVACGTVG